MTDVNEVWGLLEQGRAQQAAIMSDERFTEEYRQKLAGPIYQNALADAKALAEELRKQAAEGLASAESALIEQMRAYDATIDNQRLVAAQNELSALAKGRWEDVQRAIDTAIRTGDAVTLRAATVALPVLRERATGDFSPLRNRAGDIENLGATIAEHRARLEPQTLQAARGRLADAQQRATDLDRALYSINQRTAVGGGPGLFAQSGPTVIEHKKDGGLIFSRPGGWW